MDRRAIAAFLCFLVLAATAAGAANETRRSWEATISARLLNVRAGPGEGHAIVTKLKRGDKARAFDEDGRWVHIHSFDDSGTTGWVHRSFIRLPKDFLAPAFGDAENAFLEWASERGDLSEVSVESDNRISLVLSVGVATASADEIAREVACAWRDRLEINASVVATVWPPEGPQKGWVAQTSCP
ncbi:MAG: hypothetical protein CL566_08590 [Alphaproteobacteria bacterium]|nr:hypothetical protein [Alphaproteobacteria bacterium]|tara:strand:+ start:885 stop:1439 length:555 start_codon:yes stop_codon:yes gene_type:complete